MKRRVRISARKSDLARLQAYQVGDRLRLAHPSLTIEYLFKESLGDKNLSDPLWKMPERGVFTEDFVGDLLEERTDLVVHSWKDLPTDPRPGLALLATLPRADTRDLFLLRRASFGKPEITALTSSPRRTFSATSQLAALLPFSVTTLTTKPVRGNVLTRIKKLAAGEGDALFLAKAALDRLLSSTQEEFASARAEIRSFLDDFFWMVLPLSLFPTAPAQGALAIEAKAGRHELQELLQSIHCAETAACVEQERSRFAGFGGGCHQKIGITVIPHPRFGQVEFFHGEPKGQPASRSLTFARVGNVPQTNSRWPLHSRENIFARELLPATENPGKDLFVARDFALPEHWQVGSAQLVWTAGTRTWRRLAERGIWVNGTSDSLGESLPEVHALAGRPPVWTKLTHSGSRNEGVFPCLATYRLAPTRTEAPPLVQKYFWMSESSFRWAVERRPEIRSAHHSTGPGYTADAIEKELGRPVEVFYNLAHWLAGGIDEET